jgi:hypothetical protein
MAHGSRTCTPAATCQARTRYGDDQSKHQQSGTNVIKFPLGFLSLYRRCINVWLLVLTRSGPLPVADSQQPIGVAGCLLFGRFLRVFETMRRLGRRSIAVMRSRSARHVIILWRLGGSVGAANSFRYGSEYRHEKSRLTIVQEDP